MSVLLLCATSCTGSDDAGPTSCNTAGDMRSIACGNCGLLSQRCSAANVWEDVSSCLSEGECAPAATERDTSRCGDRSRICDDACAWRGWTVTTPQGECEAPETRTPTGLTCSLSEVAVSDCTAACAWVDSCRSGCERAPGTSRTGATPICIPAGSFVLGSTSTDVSTAPETTVTLSTYYIDREMVTAGRYRACVAAGVCEAPPPNAPFEGLVDEAIAVELPYESAAAFCEWDGGRLPTEYEWEKAARGPSPDARLVPFTGTPTCEVTHFCTGRVVEEGGPPVLDPTAVVELLPSALPGSYSPWGVHQLGAGVFEHTSTLFKSGYAGLSTVDPGDQPGAGPERTHRGSGGISAEFDLPSRTWSIRAYEPSASAVTRWADPGYAYSTFGFRCVY
jgi:formylglycine-generating enzyme required for sulfatase activity